MFSLQNINKIRKNISFIDDQILKFDLKPCTGQNRSQTWRPAATNELELRTGALGHQNPENKIGDTGHGNLMNMLQKHLPFAN